MLRIFKFVFLVSLSSPIIAQTNSSSDTDVLKSVEPSKKEEIKPVEKKQEAVTHKLQINETKTLNINTNVRPDKEMDEQTFCAKTKKECLKECNDWLKEQKKLLKSSVKIAKCGNARDLYGKEVDDCMSVLCKGTIKYVVK